MNGPRFLGTAMGAAPIALLEEKKLPFLSPNAQRLRSNQAPSALPIEPPHGLVVHKLVEGRHQLQRRPVDLQEGKVRIGNDDVDVALDVLERAVQNIERKNRPSVNVTIGLDGAPVFSEGIAKKAHRSSNNILLFVPVRPGSVGSGGTDTGRDPEVIIGGSTSKAKTSVDGVRVLDQ